MSDPVIQTTGTRFIITESTNKQTKKETNNAIAIIMETIKIKKIYITKTITTKKKNIILTTKKE